MRDKEIIHIGKEEEITSIVDRLTQTEENEVDLVIPKKASLAEDSISLRLLKREVDYLSKNVSLIFLDDDGMDSAEELGFNVKKAKAMDYKEKPIKEKAKSEKEDLISNLAEEFNREKSKGFSYGSYKKTKKVKSDNENFETETEINDFKDNDTNEENCSRLSFFKKPTFALSRKSKADADYASAQRMADIVEKEEQEKKKRKNNKEESSLEKEYYDLDDDQEKKPIYYSSEKEEESYEKDEDLREEDLEEESYSKDLPLSNYFKKRSFLNCSNWLSKLLGGFFVLIIIAVVLVVYFVLPKAEVNIYPKKEEAKINLELKGSVNVSAVDVSSNEIPLQKIEVCEIKSQKFKSTGKKDMTQRATGEIIIYNEYSSAPQTLVATTRFKSPDGKVFRIPRTITVPGAKIDQGEIVPQSIKVKVVADKPGEEYNIGPTNFTIPGFKESGLMGKYNGFYAESKNSMTGGVEGEAKFVSENDIKEAKSELEKEIKEKALNQLKSQISDDFEILEDGIKNKVKNLSVSAEAGDLVDDFEVEMEIVSIALVYKKNHLKQLVELNLTAEAFSEKKAISDTQKINWRNLSIDWENFEAEMELEAREDLAYKIKTEELKNNLAGKSEDEVRNYLSGHDHILKSEVVFWPFWVKSIPKEKEKIEITIKY